MTCAAGRGTRRATRGVALLLVAVTVAACAAGGVTPGGTVAWRSLTVDLPGTWVEIDRTSNSLYVADRPGSTEPGARGEQQVGTQFMIDPSTTASDLRRFVTEQEGMVERDDDLVVAGLPARAIQYTFTAGEVPLRERVVLVPSRDLVILQQPTPMRGETAGPEWFTAHLGELDAVLAGITFGAPEGFLDR